MEKWADLAADLRAEIEKTYAPSRERSLAITKLDELELWMNRCKLTPPLPADPTNQT